jgi:hypothetical protein
MLHLSNNHFLYFSCRAPSLTRGRFCNLQCNEASSISSYIATDGLLASSYWCRAPNNDPLETTLALVCKTSSRQLHEALCFYLQRGTSEHSSTSHRIFFPINVLLQLTNKNGIQHQKKKLHYSCIRRCIATDCWLPT